MGTRELVPGLPDDIALECLVRISHKSHQEMKRVCRDWKSLISSRDFYLARRKAGTTQKSVCLLQALPKTEDQNGPKKASTVPKFRLSLYNPKSRNWERIPPVPEFEDSGSIPMFCQIIGLEGKIFVIGGWNPSSLDAIKSVFIYDCSSGCWRRGSDMRSCRSFFACGVSGRKIFVAGGHDENKNALKSCEVYDVDSDKWEDCTELSEERDECRGIVLPDGKFTVVSGYGTDSQGEFSTSSEILNESGRWEITEGLGDSKDGFVLGSASGSIYCVKGNGEVWRIEDLKMTKIGYVPVGNGRVVAACAGFDPLEAEIVVLVHDQQDGVCKGMVHRPRCKEQDQWEDMGCAGEEFTGIVQAACPVDI